MIQLSLINTSSRRAADHLDRAAQACDRALAPQRDDYVEQARPDRLTGDRHAHGVNNLPDLDPLLLQEPVQQSFQRSSIKFARRCQPLAKLPQQGHREMLAAIAVQSRSAI